MEISTPPMPQNSMAQFIFLNNILINEDKTGISRASYLYIKQILQHILSYNCIVSDNGSYK